MFKNLIKKYLSYKTLIILIFFCLIFSITPNKILADKNSNCNIELTAIPTDGSPLNDKMKELQISVKSNVIPKGDYYVAFRVPNSANPISTSDGDKGARLKIDFSPGDTPTIFKIKHPNSNNPASSVNWQVGNYVLYFIPYERVNAKDFEHVEENAECRKSFEVFRKYTQSCASMIVEKDIYPDTPVTLKVDGITPNASAIGISDPRGGYDIYVKGKLTGDPFVPTSSIATKNLGTWTASDELYSVEIKERCGLIPWGCNPATVCNPTSFQVKVKGSSPSITTSDPYCEISPNPVSDLEDTYIVAKNLIPNTRYFATTVNEAKTTIISSPKAADTNGDLILQLNEPDQKFTKEARYVSILWNHGTRDKVPGCEKPFAVLDTRLAIKESVKKCVADGKCVIGGGLEVVDCSKSSTSNPGVATAIGCIHTNPTKLVEDILKFVLGIGGGLAFLLMLVGAFQMLTSAGNPDHLNAGRERLTNAVIGLLLIIFAVLILQILGVDILQIPGFER